MKSGTRVLLIERPKNKYTSLRAGDTGQVTGYDPTSNVVQVDWDNGSKLPVPFGIISEKNSGSLH